MKDKLKKAKKLLTSVDGVQGLVSIEQGETLERLACEAAATNPGTAIVEIGSYLGLSTLFLARGASAPEAVLPTTRVFAIDLWDMEFPSEKFKQKLKNGKPRVTRNSHAYPIRFNSTAAFDTFIRNMEPYSDIVTWVKGDSKEIAKVWNQPISLLFIDGAHDGVSMLADYTGYSPHVVSGGFIAFDDVKSSAIIGIIETIIKPSGEWHNWQVIGKMATAQKV